LTGYPRNGIWCHGSPLHVFQKKSPKGVKTAQLEVDLVERRLKVAQEDYEARYGKTTR
jgi:hypothetical protein